MYQFQTNGTSGIALTITPKAQGAILCDVTRIHRSQENWQEYVIPPDNIITGQTGPIALPFMRDLSSRTVVVFKVRAISLTTSKVPIDLEVLQDNKILPAYEMPTRDGPVNAGPGIGFKPVTVLEAPALAGASSVIAQKRFSVLVS